MTTAYFFARRSVDATPGGDNDDNKKINPVRVGVLHRAMWRSRIV